MHEGPPSSDEGRENQEVNVSETFVHDKGAVTAALRENAPEAEQMLVELIASWEANVGESFAERVGHIRNTAQLYRESGLFERAFNTLGDAAEMAYQEGQDDLCDQIEQEMANLKKRGGTDLNF